MKNKKSLIISLFTIRYIPPNPDNGSEADLMIAMRSAPERKHFVRLHTIRLLILGYSLREVAIMLGYTTRNIHNWIVLWNNGGIDALLPHQRSGRPRKLSPQDKDKIIHLLEHPEEAEETHWTAKKLHGFITKEWSIEMGYSTLTHNLNEWDLR